MPTQLTVHQCDVQAPANVVFHAAHEAGKESREHQSVQGCPGEAGASETV